MRSPRHPLAHGGRNTRWVLLLFCCGVLLLLLLSVLLSQWKRTVVVLCWVSSSIGGIDRDKGEGKDGMGWEAITGEPPDVGVFMRPFSAAGKYREGASETRQVLEERGGVSCVVWCGAGGVGYEEEEGGGSTEGATSDKEKTSERGGEGQRGVWWWSGGAARTKLPARTPWLYMYVCIYQRCHHQPIVHRGVGGTTDKKGDKRRQKATATATERAQRVGCCARSVGFGGGVLFCTGCGVVWWCYF